MAQFEKVSETTNLTVYAITGKVTFDELIGELNNIYEMNVTEKFLWDFSVADLSDITSLNLRQIINFVGKNAGARAVGKTAFVVASELGYGLGRMYELLSKIDDHPVSYNVFRNIDEAMAWLEKKEPL
jgi:hypothetical protein